LGPAVHLSSGVPIVARLLGPVYPEVKTQADRIAETVRSEEERFGVALRQGMERLQPLLERGTLHPDEVFHLHDTLRVPIELTAELAKERRIAVDLGAVAALMQSQRDRSRTATSNFSAPLAGRPATMSTQRLMRRDAGPSHGIIRPPTCCTAPCGTCSARRRSRPAPRCSPITPRLTLVFRAR